MALVLSADSGVSGLSSISFPATQVSSNDPNTLDDYEEGTWTASLGMNSTYSTTSGLPNTTITSTGRYTKIGRQCLINCYFDVTGYSNYVAYYISGLPFSSGTSSNGYPLAMGHQRGIRFVYGTSIISDCQISALVSQSSTSIALQAASNTSAFSGWYYISNEPAQGKYISVNGIYETSA